MDRVLFLVHQGFVGNCFACVCVRMNESVVVKTCVFVDVSVTPDYLILMMDWRLAKIKMTTPMSTQNSCPGYDLPYRIRISQWALKCRIAQSRQMFFCGYGILHIIEIDQ